MASHTDPVIIVSNQSSQVLNHSPKSCSNLEIIRSPSPQVSRLLSRAPPKLVVSACSTPRSSPTSSLMTPDRGSDSSSSYRSPKITRQLILRTGRSPSPSPNLQPRAFTTYNSSRTRAVTPVSDLSSEYRAPTYNDTCMSTISHQALSFKSLDMIENKSNKSKTQSDAQLSTNDDRYTYTNPAFDSNEEIVMKPLALWRRGADDGESGEDDAFVEEMVVIERPIYSQKDFDQGFEGGKRPPRTLLTWLKAKSRKCEFSPVCVRRFINSFLPFLGIMKTYNPRRELVPDLIAGLTVGIMHIPQGMAYGQLSTLPPVYGLYVSFWPVILYFFFGTSKHVSLGTFAVISLMVGSAVDKGMKARGLVPTVWNATVGSGDNATFEMMDNSADMLDMRLKLAMSVTFAVGIIQLLLGVLQLGFLTVYLSDPLISGFTTGAACHVFTSQIKHIFGIPMGQYSGAFKLLFSYRDIFLNLPKTNAVTFIASIVCMFLLVFVKEYINSNPKIKPKLKMPVPVELIVVVLGTVISYFVKLEEDYKVKIVGDIPVGIPPPNINCFAFLDEVISDSIAIAIVAFAISVSMAKIFAKKHDYDVDSNQELLAYGLCNVFSSFFASFVSAVSLSRSLVQENVGGKTQVTGLFSSVLLIIVLLVVGPYFKTLPNCILASIILVALKGMFLQFLDLKSLWSISVIDFTTWIITFAATVLLDVDLGLIVGVGYALLTVIIRSQRPYSCLLGQVPGTDIYKDIGVYKMAEEAQNIKIFRFDSAIFFANAEFFKSSLYKLTVDPNILKKKQRKLNKQKKRENKLLMNMTMNATGSTTFSPEDTEMEEKDNETDNDHKIIDNSTPSSNKLDSQAVVTQSSATTTTTTSGKPSNEPNAVLVEIDQDPNRIKELPTLTDVHFIILDCSTMSYVDSMGVKVLQQVITEFKAFNITVYLAQCKSSVREMFECTNFYKTGSKQYLFVTIHDAVVTAQMQQWSIMGDNRESNLPFDNANNNADSQDKTIETDTNTKTSSRESSPPSQQKNNNHNSYVNSIKATVSERTKI